MNPIDFTKEKEKRSKKKSIDGGAELTPTQIRLMKIWEMRDLIDAGVLGGRFHRVADEEGVRILAENDRREVRFVGDEYLVNKVINYCAGLQATDISYLWRAHEALEAVTLWKAGKPSPMPSKIGWLTDAEVCFKRLDFDFCKRSSYEHPTWDVILGNITENRDQFKAFIGSIFEPKSYRQQYLWMYGDGGDGKGSVLEFLSTIMGTRHCAHVQPNIEHDFWTENLASARVAYFSDCKHYELPANETFLMYSGDAPLVINRKREKKFEIVNDLKFIFASNQPPAISNFKRDLRRAIIVPFKARQDRAIDDPLAFKAGLMNEAEAFICECVATYRGMVGDKHGEIKPNEEHLLDIAADGDADKRAFLDQFFELETVERDQGFPGQPLFDYWVKDTRMTGYIERFFKGSHSKKTELRNWLKRQPGVSLKPVKINGVNIRKYLGIREKNPNIVV